jgi:hypothetical protein
MGINPDGTILFEALLKQERDFRAIYLSRESSLARVTAIGDPTPVGGHFSGLRSPEFSPDGTVAFAGEVEGGQSATGLFLAVPTGIYKLRKVTKEGHSDK